MLNSWTSDTQNVSFIAREKKRCRHHDTHTKRKRGCHKPSQSSSGKAQQKELKKIRREVLRLRLLLLKTSSDLNSAVPMRMGLQLIASLSDKLDTLCSNKEQLGSSITLTEMHIC